MATCKNNVVPLHKPAPLTIAQFVPLIPPSSRDLPEGYAEQPVIKDGKLNDRYEPQGPSVIDFIALRNMVSIQAACDDLKDALAAGHLTARGPDGPIDRAFWQNATIYADGEAFDLKSKKKLPWFMVQARDVLAAWPPPPAWVVQPEVTTLEPQPTPTAPQERGDPEPTNPPPTQKQPKQKFDEKEARGLLVIRRNMNWKERPTEVEVQQYLLQHFDTVPRPTLRLIRRSIWPAARRSGPKKKTDIPAE
jgi:hypothetical protein